MELGIADMPMHLGLFPEYLQLNYPLINPYSFSIGKSVQYISTFEFCNEVFKTTAILREIGVKKGDYVISYLHSNPDWNILDSAILRCGAIHVPFFYWDADIEHALRHNYWQFFIRCSDLPIQTDENHFSASRTFVYENIKALCKKEDALPSIKNAPAIIEKNDPAYVLYSLNNEGETSPYVISHNNLITVSWYAGDQLPLPAGFVYLSMLPAAKVFERASMLTHNLMGCTVHYPSAFGLPFNQIRESSAAVTSIVPALLSYPIRVPDNFIGEGERGRIVSFWDFPNEKLSEFLGAEFRYFVCGGADIPQDVFQKFESAGIRVFEGYGLTQTTAGFSINSFQNYKKESKGKIMPHMQVEIANDGEILVKGDSLCLGLLSSDGIKSIADSAGWLHTGDLGYIDDDGFLFLTGLKKSPFKVANGMYVNASLVEKDLTKLLHKQVMVCKRIDGNIHTFIVGEMDESDVELLKRFKSNDLLALSVFSYSVCDELLQTRPFNYLGSDQDVIIGKKQRKL